MMTLTTTTSYAIQALGCLASPDCECSMIADVAACANVPAAYLVKVMKRLSNAGIIISKRGSKGGIWLAREPDHISLLDIVTAIDGADYLEGCLLGREYCSDERACPAHEFWKPLRARIRRKLATLTLADIVAFQKTGKVLRAHLLE